MASLSWAPEIAVNIKASRRVLAIARYSRPSSSLTPCPEKYSSVRSSRPAPP
jgi:hypothetical protein